MSTRQEGRRPDDHGLAVGRQSQEPGTQIPGVAPLVSSKRNLVFFSCNYSFLFLIKTPCLHRVTGTLFGYLPESGPQILIIDPQRTRVASHSTSFACELPTLKHFSRQTRHLQAQGRSQLGLPCTHLVRFETTPPPAMVVGVSSGVCWDVESGLGHRAMHRSASNLSLQLGCCHFFFFYH